MQQTRVLIVEDESIVALDIKSTLKNLGYDVAGICAYGEEAVKAVEDLSPHLVLMDIVLKGDMDGIEAAEIIRQRFHVPVVFLTSHADKQTLERAKITKPFGYIIKPFDDREIHSNIEMALHSHDVEKRLRESEELFRVLAENSVAGIFIVENDRFVYANPEFLKITGYSADELEQIPFSQLLCNEFRYIAESMHNCDVAAKMQKTIRITSRDQDERWLELATNTVVLRDRCSGIGTAMDVNELKQLQMQMEIFATTDMLTGCYNRRKFEDIFRVETERARRYRQPLAAVLFDIDHFKQVNDTHGHNVGDDVLRTLAALVRGSLRPSDYLVRWGGEEFLVLATETNARQGGHLAQRIRRLIERSEFAAVGTVTISLGVTEFVSDDELHTFIKRADDALYLAKNKGRNRVEVHGLSSEEARETGP
ncbi:diguanylate cyclase [Desulfurispirillum indicum]|uniref:diguanylate cyclase n=1 Tax=Desulfurispirillum indicum (strain ATCC BAA-1389 / DSM 22839 / S5) TaxID=653733 RepID=E6W5X7_DESIS|nr:diguanylate cyclase [Desulfurispirillum indicum]ADU67262.1 diguanylate cyclase [Desulfurispirillum indicum S5]UCZ56612.1 diguanylate cyclase [Desulfurispirillum indicum]